MSAPAAPLRRWSIRTRIRVALAALLLLIGPQIGLTVHYLVQLQTQSHRFSELTRYAVELGTARSAASDLRVPGAAVATGADRDRFRAAEQEVRTHLTYLTASMPEFEAANNAIAHGLDAVSQSGEAWFAAVLSLHANSPSRAALEAQLREDTAEGGATVGGLERRFRSASEDLGARFNGALEMAYEQLRNGEERVQLTVRHADRNLIALTMVTLVFVITLVVLLPARIVGPLTRLTSAVRIAGPATALPAIEAADEETGALADAFRETMQQVRELDALKRERIIQDTAQIRLLLERVGAAAILDDRFAVEHSSRAFDRMLELDANDADQPLPVLMAEGGEALRKTLLRVLQTREPVIDRELILDAGDGQSRSLRCDVDLCQARGRATNVLMVLRSEIVNEPS
ncbi:MAG: nitrogen fixation/metabolism regulation signal transduction histidine kinase [Myxococcota bacterium]